MEVKKVGISSLEISSVSLFKGSCLGNFVDDLSYP